MSQMGQWSRRLNSPRFLQRRECAILLDGLESLHRNVNNDRLLEFCHVDATLLEIRLSANLASWIELCRADAIGIPSADLRALAGDVAGACHIIIAW